MIRPAIRLAALFTLLVALLLPRVELFAQENVTQGNVIQSITLLPDIGGDYMLQIKGIFNPKELERIRIRQKANSTKMTLVLPQTLVDTKAMGGKQKKFKKGLPLDLINLDESLSGDTGAVVYQTTVTVQTRKVLRSEIISPLSEKMIQIKLSDASKPRRGEKNIYSARALKSSRERQEKFSAERQLKLEKQKQASMKKAKTEATDILKQYQKPVVMQLSIINGTGQHKKGYQLSVYLGSMQKKSIESTLGLKLDVVNIAHAKKKNVRETTIYYKENYLKAALLLAKKISGAQKVVPMLNKNQKIGVDVEIYLGTNYR